MFGGVVVGCGSILGQFNTFGGIVGNRCHRDHPVVFDVVVRKTLRYS